jgi:hypothetical protein
MEPENLPATASYNLSLVQQEMNDKELAGPIVRDVGVFPGTPKEWFEGSTCGFQPDPRQSRAGSPSRFLASDTAGFRRSPEPLK